MAKQFTPDVKHLYIKPIEAQLIAVMVLDFMETMKSGDHLKWNKEAQKDRAEMIAVAQGLRAKLQKLGFDMKPLEPLQPGEENDFLED